MNAYRKSLDLIYNLSGRETGLRLDLRLERVSAALALFDDPQHRFRVCHVAGTNGKGSTAAMMHAVLSAQGHRVGLYTSPHLESFTERIRVGRRRITQAAVASLVREVAERTGRAAIALSFFEFVTVMAFLHFARHEVDVAVVEVGLGGRLDATNVVRPSVCVVTTISRDHEHFLGTRIGDIAREKGGIIKAGVPVVFGALPPAASRVLRRIAREREAPMREWGKDFSVAPRPPDRFDYHGREWRLDGLRLGLRGGYQRHNAGVALAALEALNAVLPVGAEAVRAGLASVRWAGRFELLPGTPPVLLDGAHNLGGVEALVNEARGLFGGGKVRLLFASMGDKGWPAMLRALCAVSREVVLTRNPSPRGAPLEALRGAVPPGLPVTVVEDPAEAISGLMTDRRRRDDPILVAGSLYLVGTVRAALSSRRRGPAAEAVTQDNRSAAGRDPRG